jgi:hypothetical protein
MVGAVEVDLKPDARRDTMPAPTRANVALLEGETERFALLR